MSEYARDLRNAGIYLAGLLILSAALVFGAPPLAERAIAGGSFGGLLSSTNAASEDPPTRLSIAVERAREIRDALAKPLPPLEPLPPITAKLAHGNLRPGARAAHHHAKLPREAMNAMAQADIGAGEPQRPQWHQSSMAVRPDPHRIY